MAKCLDSKTDVAFKRESGLNDAERAAYEGFWDCVSIEATKKRHFAEAKAQLGEAVARTDAAAERVASDGP